MEDRRRILILKRGSSYFEGEEKRGREVRNLDERSDKGI